MESTEREIQWMLGAGGDTKWGWVIYRCNYNPELDTAWDIFKRLVHEETRQFVAESDAPEIAEKADWVFVEDPELEGASRDELRRRFREWARAENLQYDDIDNAPDCRGSRYTYFIQVDKDALLSLLNAPNDPGNPGHVNIVRAWPDPLPHGEATDESDEAADWMKILATMVAPDFYVNLDNDESWYTYYRSPTHGICVW